MADRSYSSGLPVYGGSQLAIDITIRSPLQADGSNKTAADWEDGATAKRARGDKERNYPELTVGGRCRLVVLPIETGGRFGRELSDFLQQLAAARALTAPWYLRAATAAAFERRWARMLACCAATCHVRSITLSKPELLQSSLPVGRGPWLQDLLAAARHEASELAEGHVAFTRGFHVPAQEGL